MLEKGVPRHLYLPHLEPFNADLYFGTLPRAMFSLIRVFSKDGFDSVIRHVGAKEPGFLIIFVIFIGITSLGLLNVIVGAVVENVIDSNSRDLQLVRRRLEHDRNMIYKDLMDIFEESDIDGSGSLNIDEVLDALNSPAIYSKLKSIDFPVEMPDKVFNLLDFDNSKEVTIDEFITGCMRMRGDAKSKDLLAAQIALDKMKKHYEVCTAQMNSFENKIAVLDSVARGLLDHGERIFLNKQEYRVRHPNNRKTTPQAVTNAKLNEVPWERGRNHQEDFDYLPPGAIRY